MKFIINFFKKLFGSKKQSQEKYEKNENTVKQEPIEIPVDYWFPSGKVPNVETIADPVEEKKEIVIEEPKQEVKEESTIKLQDVVAPKQEPVAEPQVAEPAIQQKPIAEEVVVEIKKEPKKETKKVETKKKDFKKEKPKQQKKQDKVEKSEPVKKSKPKNK